MTMLAYQIAFAEAEERSKVAAAQVIHGMAQSLVERGSELFPDASEMDRAYLVTAMTNDTAYSERIEAAFLGWIAETHILLPPGASSTNT
jgi:hypothetical protein